MTVTKLSDITDMDVPGGKAAAFSPKWLADICPPFCLSLIELAPYPFPNKIYFIYHKVGTPM